MTTTVSAAPVVSASVQSYLGDAFSMPIMSPELAPPPYLFKDNKVVNLLFKTDPQVLEKLIPYPLKPDYSQPMLFYIGRLNIAHYNVTYNEAARAAPVIGEDGQPGYYPIVLYLDTPNPIIGGREIYGYPKKEAEEILFEEGADGVITASVTRYGATIIKVTFTAGQQVDPVPPREIAPWYTLKLIPSAEKDAPPDVMKLIRMGFEPYSINEMTMGQATLEFADSFDDTLLTQIPVTEILYSEVVGTEFTMEYGEVVHNYLAD
jgi:acetoacetate decarboxylase